MLFHCCHYMFYVLNIYVKKHKRLMVLEFSVLFEKLGITQPEV